MEKYTLCILFILYFASCNKPSDKDSRSFTIFVNNGHYYIENNLTRKIEKKTSLFHEAFNYLSQEKLKDGGSIFLRSGRYRVKSPLILASKLEVKGEGPSTSLSVADDFKNGEAVFIADTLNDIQINNLSIRQSNNISSISGIYLNHCGTSSVSGVLLLGLTGHGICLSNCSFLCRIDNCTLGKIQNTAILFKNLGKGRAGDWVPNTVSGCTIYSSGTGIELDSSIVANILGCQVFQTRGPAYYLHSQSNSVLISGCRSFQIRDVAVKVISSHELNVSGNIFCWSEREGIILDDVSWATVTANEFIDNGSYNPMDSSNTAFELNGKNRPFRVRQSMVQIKEAGVFSGVKLQNNCRGVVISSNAIFNWPAAHPMKYGIEEDLTCHHNQFVNNNINYCSAGDVLSSGMDSEVLDNLAFLPVPHAGNLSTMDTSNRLIQGFDTRLMDYYFEQQMK